MHKRVSPGSHAQRDLYERSVPHLGLWRDGYHRAFPGTRQGFQFVEGLLRVGLGKSHGAERHQNDDGQYSTKGFHVSFSLSFFLLSGQGFSSPTQRASDDP
jgi:hypothetical protein